MKGLIIIALLVLAAATLRLGYKNVELQGDLKAVCDTLLSSQKIQQQFLGNKYLQVLHDAGEPAVWRGEGIKEIHRIIANGDRGLFALRVEVGQDGSVKAMFRKVKVKMPLPRDFKRIEFLQDSAAQIIQLADLQNFKNRMAQINLLDATVDNNPMCCFGGFTVSWEAVLPDGNRHFFTTFCNQSEQFVESCMLLLRQVDDAELKQRLQR